MKWVISLLSICLVLSLFGNLYLFRDKARSIIFEKKYLKVLPEEARELEKDFRPTVLKSGLVIFENKKFPHEFFRVESRYHALVLMMLPSDSFSVSLIEKATQDTYSLLSFKKNEKAEKYHVSFPEFDLADIDGDGLADWRRKDGQYEIRLNDEWVPCRKIRLKEFKAIFPDDAVYEFRNGKWLPIDSAKTDK